LALTQSKPFVDKDSTNVIERFHGTLKDRTKVVRGFKNMETAKLLTDAWLVHYNFFKEHETLGNIPPAVKMGATPIKDWKEVITKTVVITSPKPQPKSVIPIKTRIIRKKRHPKRRPKDLKRKVYTEVSLVSPRGN